MNKRFFLSAILSYATALAIPAFAELPISKAPDDAKLYIISPKDGETTGKEITVKFGLKNMGVAPAGVERENTGHHHLIINGDLPQPGVPMGADIKHFGGGQTETTITLEPGKHTLQLVLGNHIHVPHEPMVTSEKITITVK